MRFSRIAALGAILSLSQTAVAAAKGDFAGPVICSKLKAIPKGAKLTDCNARAPLRGECRFTLKSGAMPIDYLIENGVVLDKSVALNSGAKFTAPYGLNRSDTVTSAMRKIKASTGLASKYWDMDGGGSQDTYIESDSVACGPNKSYSIYVWFDGNPPSWVSVTTLPAI